MTREIKSFYDLGRQSGWEDGRQSGWEDGRQSGWEDGRQSGWEDGKQEGKQEGVRSMLEQCIVLRFPRIAQPTLRAILSITDVELLKSIFSVACTSDSLDSFQRDVRRTVSVN